MEVRGALMSKSSLAWMLLNRERSLIEMQESKVKMWKRMKISRQ